MQTIKRFTSWLTDKFRNRGKVGKVIMAAIILVVFFGLCSILVAIISPNEKIESSAGNESSLRTQAAETVMAGIVETGMADALTPKETQTPEPTGTAIPANTPEGIDYATAVYTLSLQCTDALSTVGNLSTLAGETPTLFFDTSWTSSVETGLSDMEYFCVALGDFDEIPTGYEAADAKLKLAAKEYQNVIDLFRVGIRTFDVDSINFAADALARANSYINEATALLPK